MIAPKRKKDDSFKDFVTDALSGLGGLRVRPMFGGHGYYSNDDFFALSWKGSLYFRVDDRTRPTYEARGAKPFVYSRDGRSMTMAYYEVPTEIIEDHEKIVRWAEEAVAAGRRAKAAKTKKK